VNHLVNILVGKEDQRVHNWKHEQLRVFGIGKEHSVAQWRSIFRQLVAGGFLSVDAERYNALRLTEQARPILRGARPLRLRKIKAPMAAVKKQKSTLSPQPLPAEDEKLWQALRAKRTALARAQNVPPYVVFHDSTLREIARHKPQSEEEMLRIAGVGEKKLEKYGAEFLAAVREAG